MVSCFDFAAQSDRGLKLRCHPISNVTRPEPLFEQKNQAQESTPNYSAGFRRRSGPFFDGNMLETYRNVLRRDCDFSFINYISILGKHKYERWLLRQERFD